VAAGEASLSRDAGPFTFTATGAGSRTVYGAETLADSSVLDVSYRNNTRVSAGLRASYAVTPIVSVFADLNAARQMFDLASPFLGVHQDNTTHEASVGVRAAWGEQASVEAAIGATARRFEDPSLAPVASPLLRASAQWRPTETLTLSGTARYGLGDEALDSADPTPVTASLSGDVRYVVNPWLTLRGSAGWSLTDRAGDAETRYRLGVGADYSVNPRARFSADYGYSWREREPDPPEDEHRASIGVTFSR
jgi:hypothetical protein